MRRVSVATVPLAVVVCSKSEISDATARYPLMDRVEARRMLRADFPAARGGISP